MYADQFLNILAEFEHTGPVHFDENWKIYRFHMGLGPHYHAYCEQYNYLHDAFKEDGTAKFTLDYAIYRFLNTFA